MENTTIEDLEIIDIKTIDDVRGSLGVIEKDILPYPINRVYYLFDVPSSSKRGGHAHKELSQFLIALSGSFDVLVNDGLSKKKITLNKPTKGLLIVPGIWRELDNFSSGSVCLVLASHTFSEEDYIRNFEEFKLFKNQNSDIK